MLSCHWEPHFATKNPAKIRLRMIFCGFGGSLGGCLGADFEQLFDFFEGLIFYAFLMHFWVGAGGRGRFPRAFRICKKMTITPCSPFGSAANLKASPLPPDPPWGP